ncbi:restriction endonuclease subunit S [Ligilactobacillus salivarius]|uniref:restriction endonuclease subunit S n=1 Tax=Ligilactobacillus salivarius TaxID=1624 RepID=UPI0023684259|nr:restriction endonuclease subunit S [Ligilactobacillus salivarius]
MIEFKTKENIMENKKSSVPKLRFPGFTGAWEQRKLGDISKTKRGLTYKPSNIDNTGIRVLRSSNIKEDTFVISDNDVFVKESAVNIPFVKNGDILITAANGSTNLVGKHAIIRDIPKNSAVHGGFMLITTSKEYEFLNASMSSNWYKKFIKKYVAGGNGAIGNLRKNDLDNQKIYVPKKDEQEKIGNFFKMLDSLIALHQRKLEHLKEQKKGLLQKMFPKNGEVVPEVRFPGFTDDWEQQKLGEVATRVTRKNKNLESTLPLTISAQLGLVDQISYFDKRIASSNLTNYILLNRGEFAYNKSYSNGYPFGTVKRLNRYDKGVIPSLYIAFMPNTIFINSDFMEMYFETSLWHKEVSARASEGARNHGLLNISPSDFMDIYMKIPEKIEEQKKIAKFLEDFDSLIALHQRKLEHLELMKKGLLQQMFV